LSVLRGRATALSEKGRRSPDTQPTAPHTALLSLAPSRDLRGAVTVLSMFMLLRLASGAGPSQRVRAAPALSRRLCWSRPRPKRKRPVPGAAPNSNRLLPQVDTWGLTVLAHEVDV